jgi:hypothetical protein
MTDSADTLTLAQRAAIQNFVIYSIAPIAFLVTLAAGVGGFYLHALAYSSSYTDSFKSAVGAVTGSIVDLSEKTAAANQEATKTASQAADTLGAVQAALVDFNAKIKSVNEDLALVEQAKVDVSKLESGQFNDIAKQLLASQPDLQAAIANAGSQQVAKLSADVAALQGRMKSLQLVVGPQTTDSPSLGSFRCPPGAVVVGATFTSAAGGSHGYLDTGRVTCAPIALSQ